MSGVRFCRGQWFLTHTGKEHLFYGETPLFRQVPALLTCYDMPNTILFSSADWRSSLELMALVSVVGCPSSVNFCFKSLLFLQFLFDLSDFFLFRYDLDRSTTHPKFDPHLGSNSWPPDLASTFHVTETPALTSQPLVSFTRETLRAYCATM